MATEQRLIDANALLTGICKDCGNGCDLENNYCLLATEIMKATTVDAVEVVRCKDCKHYHQYHIGKTNDLCEWGKCKLIDMDVDMPENGFCSYGERKETCPKGLKK